MSDVVVTLPKSFRWKGAPGRVGLAAWLCEGDAAGQIESYTEYVWSVGGGRPRIEEGERVYVCHAGRLVGYAPLLRVEAFSQWRGGGTWGLIRRGGAVAVTIDEYIPGFRGFRYRWWERDAERSITNWPEIVRLARLGKPLPEIEPQLSSQRSQRLCGESSSQASTRGAVEKSR